MYVELLNTLINNMYYILFYKLQFYVQTPKYVYTPIICFLAHLTQRSKVYMSFSVGNIWKKLSNRSRKILLIHSILLCEICPNTEFFLFFSRIWIEYLILRISPYSVRIGENTDQKKLRIWILSTQCSVKFQPCKLF